MKNTKFDYVYYLLIVLLLLILAAAVRAQKPNENPAAENVASGGQFTLEKNVVGGGGNQAGQTSLALSGTGGQTVAGGRFDGGSFSLSPGFWTPDDFAPTTAHIAAGGKVKFANGRGLKNAIVTITFPSGETRTAVTTTFGYYRFADIPAGAIYIFTVSSKRFQFEQATQIRNLIDDTQGIDFVATEN